MARPALPMVSQQMTPPWVTRDVTDHLCRGHGRCKPAADPDPPPHHVLKRTPFWKPVSAAAPHCSQLSGPGQVWPFLDPQNVGPSECLSPPKWAVCPQQFRLKFLSLEGLANTAPRTVQLRFCASLIRLTLSAVGCCRLGPPGNTESFSLKGLLQGAPTLNIGQGCSVCGTFAFSSSGTATRTTTTMAAACGQ